MFAEIRLYDEIMDDVTSENQRHSKLFIGLFIRTADVMESAISGKCAPIRKFSR